MGQKILELTSTLSHPEMEGDIVTTGIARALQYTDQKINLSLYFPKSRDPFAMSIKRKVYDALKEMFPTHDEINVFIKLMVQRLLLIKLQIPNCLTYQTQSSLTIILLLTMLKYNPL